MTTKTFRFGLSSKCDFQITGKMLEEANDETLALIKKLDYVLDFEEFKTILSSIPPNVVRKRASEMHNTARIS